jgi:glycosyltransferase involved in cell wall biosynthesis
MHVVYFYQYFTTPRGSWSTRCYEFARRWVARGDRVTVVTSVYDKSDLRPSRWLERLEVDGIDVRVINVRLSNKHGIVFRVATFAIYAVVACWYALTLRADVLLASSGPITTGVPGLVGHWLRRRPLVFEVRDLWPEGAIQLGMLRSPVVQWLAQRFERMCYRASSIVVALSEDMATGVVAAAPGTRVVVVPNAADIELFGREGHECEQGLVVYTGTLGRMDNCGQIVEAARVLQERGRHDIRLLIAGDGMERPTLEARATALGLTNITFLGIRPKHEIVSLLHRATCALVTFRDVPVLASVSPNKLFDAFAAGVPVVQTTQGWIRRLIEREECGITVPPNAPEAMATAIEALVDAPGHRGRLAANAARVARNEFARDLLAARMHAALERAAGVRPGSSAEPSPSAEPAER